MRAGAECAAPPRAPGRATPVAPTGRPTCYDDGTMKSPFPGMDPYLEPHWPGLHTQLAALATAQLNGRLPDDLVARPEERVAIGSVEEYGRGVAGDVVVYQPDSTGMDPGEGGLAISAPFKLVADAEPLTERIVRIIRADDGQLVTVIEFISPANKVGAGLDEYRQKRDELLGGGVHVVEVDLIRRGNWRRLLRPHLSPAEADAPYRVTIRVGRRHTAYLYPISVRQPLPGIPIPLRPGDAEVKLDLQALLDQAYAAGRYGRTLDYTQPPDPALDEDDAVWAERLLAGRTRR